MLNFENFIYKLKNFGLEFFNLYYGMYRGFVANNQDPELLGRVQVKVPQIYGSQVMKTWAWPKGLPAGKQMGLFIMPNIDDKIWVSFENGNPQFPIWEYGWWGEMDLPLAAKTNYPKKQIWQTVAGHRIEIDDITGVIKIVNETGDYITIDATGVHINGLTQQAVLGNRLSTVLGNLCTQLQNMVNQINLLTVTTTGGPSSIPINSAAFTAIGTEINTIQTSLNDILSTKVSLE